MGRLAFSLGVAVAKAEGATRRQAEVRSPIAQKAPYLPQGAGLFSGCVRAAGGLSGCRRIARCSLIGDESARAGGEGLGFVGDGSVLHLAQQGGEDAADGGAGG